MQVSKARDLNVSSREDKALTVQRMCSTHCSIEEGDHNEEGKQLNFIQHECRTAISTVQHVLGSLQSLSDNLQSFYDNLRKIADCFEC